MAEQGHGGRKDSCISTSSPFVQQKSGSLYDHSSIDDDAIDCLLVSTYELGHTPSALAWLGGALDSAGFSFRSVDLSVETIDVAAINRARFIAFSVPMHTALRLALTVFDRVRERAPRIPVAFVGNYAALHVEMLRHRGVEYVLAGEYEAEFVQILTALPTTRPLLPPKKPLGPAPESVFLKRLHMARPTRKGIEKLDRYARFIDAKGNAHLAGHVETTRGCLQRCRHCPIPAVYNGRFVAFDTDVVLADVSAQVDAGARHITFGDPDFLNGPSHSLRICRQLHQRWPELTFDFTAQVTNLLTHATVASELVELGCVFIVTAVESLSDHVLTKLAKRHRAEDVGKLLGWAKTTGIELRPTLLPFTPWTMLEDVAKLTDWIFIEQLEANIAPVQLSIRLLVPPGSLLLATNPDLFGDYDMTILGHPWVHSDPRVDTLAKELATLTSEAADMGAGANDIELHAQIRALVARTLGRDVVSTTPRVSRSIPRVSEPWFC